MSMKKSPNLVKIKKKTGSSRLMKNPKILIDRKGKKQGENRS